MLVGYSPWGRKELDTTERLHFTSLRGHLRDCQWPDTFNRANCLQILKRYFLKSDAPINGKIKKDEQV